MSGGFRLNTMREPAGLASPDSDGIHEPTPSGAGVLRRGRRVFAFILPGAAPGVVTAGVATPAAAATAVRRWVDFLLAIAVTTICTAAAYALHPAFGLVNTVMVYLLGTAVGALRLGRGPVVVLACANMLAFDFFFVPPLFSFDVEDTRYLFTLVVMLVVALVIANLMVSIRRHRDTAHAREWRTAVLYDMSRELAVANDAGAMVDAVTRHIRTVFHSGACVLTANQDGSLAALEGPAEAGADVPHVDRAIAADVAAHGNRHVGGAIYLPMRDSRGIAGVIVVNPAQPADAMPQEMFDLLAAFAAQLALSLERVRLAAAAAAARVAGERILLRNTLLASISHDLRTPLSAIAGAGSLIAQPDYVLNTDRRATLGHLIERKAEDMSKLLSNVLELVKMESGGGALKADWHAIDDLVSLSLQASGSRLSQRRVVLDIPGDLPLILVDATLIVQIIANLLDNAGKYTPPQTTVSISARRRNGGVLLVVEDDGPGLPPGDPDRLFEKFQRGRAEGNIVGVGLGLAICRAAARIHQGDIRAANGTNGGARFEITLPDGAMPDSPAVG